MFSERPSARMPRTVIMFVHVSCFCKLTRDLCTIVDDGNMDKSQRVLTGFDTCSDGFYIDTLFVTGFESFPDVSCLLL